MNLFLTLLPLNDKQILSFTLSISQSLNRFKARLKIILFATPFRSIIISTVLSITCAISLIATSIFYSMAQLKYSHRFSHKRFRFVFHAYSKVVKEKGAESKVDENACCINIYVQLVYSCRKLKIENSPSENTLQSQSNFRLT